MTAWPSTLAPPWESRPLAWGMHPLLLALVLQGTQAPVAAPPSAPAAEATPALVASLAEQVRAEALTQAPAVSFAIRRGEQVWAFAWGLARVEGEVAATTGTRFRIASISKPLTAIAAALLVQQGALDLDADVRTLVPEFAEKPWPVTSRQLGAHLGGIRHYNGSPLPAKAPGDVVDAVAVFGDDPLVAAPGTKHAYSTFGFNLLGAVVQRAAQRDFLEFVAAEVCAPLGMPDTIPEVAGSELGEVAALYQALAGLPAIEVPRDDLGYKWPGGGFLSTASDLVRMTRAVCDDRLLGDTARALMRESAHLADGSPVAYSFGWGVGHDAAGRLMLRHSGGQRGATAYLLVYPDQDLALAILVNQGGAKLGDGRLLRRAAQRLLESWEPTAAPAK